MAIYTKTGDKGQTKVINKSGGLTPVSKNSCQIRAIGSIDELNSFLGVVRSQSSLNDLKKKILEVQRNLFVINSIIAGSNLRFTNPKVKRMEKEIDMWEGSLPALKNFIIYGGTPDSSFLFYARALARRAEREVISHSKKEEVKDSILRYLNRLSDYLFMMARDLNFKAQLKEDYWIGKKK